RMPPARVLAGIATLLATIGGCRGGASGPKVTLRYHPPAGAAYHYALDQQNAMRIEGGPMGAMPEQTFRMRMYYTQLVKGPALGGGARAAPRPTGVERESSSQVAHQDHRQGDPDSRRRHIGRARHRDALPGRPDHPDSAGRGRRSADRHAPPLRQSLRRTGVLAPAECPGTGHDGRDHQDEERDRGSTRDDDGHDAANVAPAHRGQVTR